MAGRFLISKSGLGMQIGSLNENEYSRRLPGRPDNITAVCNKPKYSKARKKKMAQRPMVKAFVAVNAEASVIWHNPERKAEWEARHKEALREGSKHNRYVPVRLWDYIRHELFMGLKEAKNASLT